MEFPEPYIYSPQRPPHTHTAILLHGRGSNGPEFAEELFSGKTSTDQPLSSCLPTWRWVFPTARERWSRQFQEELCAWFDDGPRHAGDEEEERIDGLDQSVAYVLDILKREIDLLGGDGSRVFLGGISQGMATVLWSIFLAASREGIREQRLGGVLGFCGWLPLGREVEELLRRDNTSSKTPKEKQRLVCDFALNTITSAAIAPGDGETDRAILSTPVFLSHGTDDAWVSVELGRQACQILQKAAISVEWNEFAGAEGDGHWIKEPDGLDQILRFLRVPTVRTR